MPNTGNDSPTPVAGATAITPEAQAARRAMVRDRVAAVLDLLLAVADSDDGDTLARGVLNAGPIYREAEAEILRASLA